jgi:hypothetical protein
VLAAVMCACGGKRGRCWRLSVGSKAASQEYEEETRFTGLYDLGSFQLALVHRWSGAVVPCLSSRCRMRSGSSTLTRDSCWYTATGVVARYLPKVLPFGDWEPHLYLLRLAARLFLQTGIL